MTDSQPPSASSDDFLLGGGEMGALARSLDWERTPLGPIAGWPQSLRTTVSSCLNSRFPILIWWGPQLVKIYNDAYAQILGSKHPRAFGAPGREVWPEIWQIIGPMLESVMIDGRATWSENQFLPLERHGYPEECYFTFSYSPIRDESGGIGGVFCAVTETTGQVIGERRLRVLEELAAQTSGAPTVEEACRRAMASLAGDTADLPFSVLYLFKADGSARFTGSSGLGSGSSLSPATIVASDRTSAWPVEQVMRSSAPVLVESIRSAVAGPSPLTSGNASDRALLLPIVADDGQTAGALVAGLSRNLGLDEKYRGFLGLVAGHIGSAISQARVLEQQKRRAEALAELDRAKSAFFSNVSHEFRTPLTLMLGPTEDALASPRRALAGRELDTVYRNELRLLKLVNALLDFSRIEAGRMGAARVPTDLAQLTDDLASMFRSAVERAGLSFIVNCDRLDAPVSVDREMWEKILLNLLSNALKYTREGGIEVELRDRGADVELSVRDTGVGIAPADLPRVFDRFHRVEGTWARTQEGSGIGLALVYELARLNGGSVRVDSTVGRGSAFTVSIPKAATDVAAPSPQEQPPATSTSAIAYVQEALRWTVGENADGSPVEQAAVASAAAGDPEVARESVLVADDNADMREYLVRVLQPHWNVTAVSDGEAALEAVSRRRPDLILTDVMMPRVDGFQLLDALRANEETAAIPVVMVSARAGEEARVAALQRGADDYIVKPFSSRELVARIHNHMLEVRHARERARLLERELAARREAELQREQLYSFFMQAPTPVVVLRGREHVIELVNPVACRLYQRAHAALIGRPLFDAVPELRGQVYKGLLDQVFESGEAYVGTEAPVTFGSPEGGPQRTAYFNFVYSPVRNASGEVAGVFVLASEVTAQVLARNEMDRLRAVAESANRAKDEFLAMLGHELRNPLAPILTALQVMSLRQGVGAARERAVIERQVNHLTRLVDDLLDVSRITRGKVVLKKERLEVAEIVANAIEVASPLLEQRRHVLNVRVPRTGLVVDGDAMRLRQVVSNLLTNAAKYTEPEGSISVVAEAEGDSMVLRVRDTGIGITPAMLPRVFDLFAQERQALDRAHGGLGLGLTIVRNLVALHGGAVSADSNGPGQGSEFTIRLPLAPAAVGEPDHLRDVVPQSSVPAAAVVLRVLVVDDNVDAAQMLAEALTSQGHQTRIAHHALAALSACEEFGPDVALVDIGLPVMDGYELAERLRAEGPAHLRLIAVTGYGQPADLQRSRVAGFDEHLVKPIDLELLERALHAHGRLKADGAVKMDGAVPEPGSPSVSTRP